MSPKTETKLGNDPSSILTKRVLPLLKGGGVVVEGGWGSGRGVKRFFGEGGGSFELITSRKRGEGVGGRVGL